jgi:hypothetical protein
MRKLRGESKKKGVKEKMNGVCTSDLADSLINLDGASLLSLSACAWL